MMFEVQMARLNILTEEDPLLRKKSKDITEITPRIKQLLDDMVQTMRQANGVGLAAPQVGVLRRAVVIECEENVVYKLINPKIVFQEGIQKGPEGCLSIPGKSGTVERPNHVIVSALNENGEEIQVDGKELLARALCHEIDHLDGILYIDKAEEISDNE